MVKESAVENAKSVYLQNPYWKKAYDEAPSDAARRHCELDFYNSWYFGSKDGIAEQRRIEKNLTLDDWVKRSIGLITCGGGLFFYWGIAQGRSFMYYGCINNHLLWKGGQEHEEKNYSDADRAGDAARDDAGDGVCGDEHFLS